MSTQIGQRGALADEVVHQQKRLPRVGNPVEYRLDVGFVKPSPAQP